MNDSLNNKELVAAGHEFAKALSSDTAIIDIAKMVSRLAERLDCTTAALREMMKQRDALAAENAGLNTFIADECYVYGPHDAEPLDAAIEKPETPATDAWRDEMRAQGVESAGEYLKRYAQGLHEEARMVLQDAGELCNGFAAQLRQGGAE